MSMKINNTSHTCTPRVFHFVAFQTEFYQRLVGLMRDFWIVLGNTFYRLQGVKRVLLKTPSIGTTYEDFDSFGVVY